MFLTEGGVRPTQVVFLLGGISLLVADRRRECRAVVPLAGRRADSIAEGARIQSLAQSLY